MATIRKREWTTAGGLPRVAWLCDMRDQAGRRRYKQFPTRKAADAWLVKARGEVAAGIYTADSESVTVAQAALLWIEHSEQAGLEPATIAGYRSHLRYIEPLLGGAKLSRLTRPQIEGFVDQLLAMGCSRGLAKKVLGSLKAILNEGQRRGLASWNPAQPVNVKIAGRHQPRIEIPTPQQIRDLLAQAQGRERVLLVLAIFCGLRASEIRGLTWADCDFQQRLVHVRQRATNAGKIGSPKSAAARRSIPLAPIVLNALREWRLQSQGEELLFAGSRPGAPASYNSMRGELGPLHRFRHAFVSWLISQGVNAKRVSVLAGHTSIQTTFDIYGHLFTEDDLHERFAAGQLALVGE